MKNGRIYKWFTAVHGSFHLQFYMYKYGYTTCNCETVTLFSFNQLTEICTKLNLQLIRVLSIDFRKGSVLVDTTLEFSQNITEDQKQGLKDAVQNGFTFQGGVTGRCRFQQSSFAGLSLYVSMPCTDEFGCLSVYVRVLVCFSASGWMYVCMFLFMPWCHSWNFMLKLTALMRLQ